MCRSNSPLFFDFKPRQTIEKPSTPIISYHDIRIHSPHKNVILITGSPNDSENFVISGGVVFSILEKVCVQSISLKLVGTYNIHFVENFQTSDGNIIATCPFREEECILDCEWDNLLTSSEGKILEGEKGKNFKRNNKILSGNSQLENNFTNYRQYVFAKDIPFGKTPFPNKNSSEKSVYELPAGNYFLPFKITLPGNIPETVDSLKTASIVYSLESKINTLNWYNKDSKINNKNNTLFSAFKYIRFIRTLSLLQLAFNEDFLTENSWVGKLQYKIRIPKKIIPLGSTLKIYLLIIPIIKNLKLGKITIQIAQQIKINSKKANDFDENNFNEEKIIYHHTLPTIPSAHLPLDTWALEARLPTSNLIKTCSPDIETVDDLISVKHKLILYISLINPDGHVSQIKSKIPLGFYIKPNSLAYGQNTEIDNNTGKVKFLDGKNKIFDVEEDINFAGYNENGSNSSNIPELLLCHVDELNPDSFLFGDNTNDEYYIGVDYRNESLLTGENLTSQNDNVPPAYADSVKDILFEPNLWCEGTSPIMTTPINAGSSFTSLSKLVENVPSYKEVYDDGDVLTVGEPTPLYELVNEQPKKNKIEYNYKGKLNELNGYNSLSVPNTRPISPMTTYNNNRQTQNVRRTMSSTLLQKFNNLNTSNNFKRGLKNEGNDANEKNKRENIEDGNAYSFGSYRGRFNSPMTSFHSEIEIQSSGSGNSTNGSNTTGTGSAIDLINVQAV